MVSGIGKVSYRAPEKRVYDLRRDGQRPQNRSRVIHNTTARPGAEEGWGKEQWEREERERSTPGDHIDERA